MGLFIIWAKKDLVDEEMSELGRILMLFIALPFEVRKSSRWRAGHESNEHCTYLKLVWPSVVCAGRCDASHYQCNPGIVETKIWQRCDFSKNELSMGSSFF